MCYSYRDYQMEEEARRRLWEKEQRKRREKRAESERPAEKRERELVRA